MQKEGPRARWRYIAFEIECGAKIARSDFLGAIMSAARSTPLSDSFRITVFEGDFGILKVPHTLKDDAIKVLASISTVRGEQCSVRTLRTSGTILTLKVKYKDRMADTGSISE